MRLGPIWWPAETSNMSLPGLLDLYFLCHPNLSYGFWLDFSYLIRLRRSATVAVVLRYPRAVHHRDLMDQGSYPRPSVTIVGLLFANKPTRHLRCFKQVLTKIAIGLGVGPLWRLKKLGQGQVRYEFRFVINRTTKNFEWYASPQNLLSCG